METLPNWIAIVILGLIQGITEFLPISSTCHLLIPQNLSWLPCQSDLFSIVIQSGALVAVVAAIFPGTSRAGASIIIAMALGSARPSATEFSFLVGIPTLMAAGAFETFSVIPESGTANENRAMIALGTLVSAISAFVVVRWLIRFVQSHSFNGFARYRLVRVRPYSHGWR